MKSLRITLSLAVLSFAAMAFAQHDMQKTSAVPTDAQKSFDKLKTLAGTWDATVTTDPPIKEMGNGDKGQVLLRVTSRGNALVHEMGDLGRKDDPTTYDHPVTMFYLDRDQLILIHYCDAGNRPRMAARTSPDGKTVEFDFLDVSGNTEYGNMQHAVFTFIDANHHTEDWTFKLKGDKQVRAHFDLQRAKPQLASASQK